MHPEKKRIIHLYIHDRVDDLSCVWCIPLYRKLDCFSPSCASAKAMNIVGREHDALASQREANRLKNRFVVWEIECEK